MARPKLPELRQPSKKELDKIEQGFVKKFLMREEDKLDDDFLMNQFQKQYINL